MGVFANTSGGAPFGFFTSARFSRLRDLSDY
jgi:hypothetical protein